MSSPLNIRTLSATGLVLSLLMSLPVRAQEPQQEQGKMVDNPHYLYWHHHKLGSTVVHEERTKLTTGETPLVPPQGPDEKRIALKLLEVNDKVVVVEMVVTEREPLGYVQAAPTKFIYPAKVRKEDLEHEMQMTGGKEGEDTVKIKDKELKVKTREGTIKEPDNAETSYKLWLSDEVPGSVVKKVQTTRQDGTVVAETTVTTVAFNTGE